MRIQWLALGVLGLSGCGGTQDELTAEEHRRLAAEHETQADSEDAQYDPEAERRRTRARMDYGLDVYNPTEHHRAAAAEHREHAAEHLAAAQELEAFEMEECASFPPETRGLCPLTGQVEGRCERVDDGVVVRFRSDVNVEAALDHVRCHIAFARVHGPGVEHCTLYIPGLRVEAGADGRSARFTVPDDADNVEALRGRLFQCTNDGG
jgi:hypothetical protein